MIQNSENKFSELLKNNSEFALFREVESLLDLNLKGLVIDMYFKKEILWIKVKHPSASLLLLMQKMAIMSKLKRLSNSFYIKDLKVIVASDSPLKSSWEDENTPLSVGLAPTGMVEGEEEPVSSPQLKELMEALRSKIQERKD